LVTGCTASTQRPAADQEIVASSASRAPCAPPRCTPEARDWGGALGQRVVDFRGDRDTIFASNQGHFRAIGLHVSGGPLEMYNMRITFGNGEVYSPNVRLRFAQGTTGRRIDLPGGQRIVRRIDFFYRSVGPPSGKATVRVAGRR